MAQRRAAGPARGGALLLHRAFRAMGTDIALWVRPRAGAVPAARRALTRAAAYVRLVDRCLSRFQPESELSRLNRDGAARVSRLTFSAISAALEAAHATGGLFDPTVHRAMLAAGYDRSFEQLVSEGPSLQSAAAGLAAPGRFQDVMLNARRRTVTLPPGVGLDLGGIAKGWAADTLAQRLGRYGAALADLGGDIAVAGTPPDGDGWEIEVEDPFAVAGTRPLAVLRLRCGGVATSGVLRRRWPTAQGTQHHLIDPRTGRPAVSDVVAVTVVAPTAAAAEVAAKATLLLGAAAGRAALEASPGLAGLLVAEGGAVIITRGLDALVVREP